MTLSSAYLSFGLRLSSTNFDPCRQSPVLLLSGVKHHCSHVAGKQAFLSHGRGKSRTCPWSCHAPSMDLPCTHAPKTRPLLFATKWRLEAWAQCHFTTTRLSVEHQSADGQQWLFYNIVMVATAFTFATTRNPPYQSRKRCTIPLLVRYATTHNHATNVVVVRRRRRRHRRCSSSLSSSSFNLILHSWW